MIEVWELCVHGEARSHLDFGGKVIPETCPGGRALTLNHVGLLIGDDEFVPQDIVDQHLPFAVPLGVRVRAVYTVPLSNPGDR